jgi:formyltetrahydrofolate hydrolase
MRDFTLTLSCAQRPGIVHAITRFLTHHDADILEHQQFDDAAGGQLFVRTAFRAEQGYTEERLIDDFAVTAAEFGMSFHHPRGPRSAGARHGLASRNDLLNGVTAAAVDWIEGCRLF